MREADIIHATGRRVRLFLHRLRRRYPGTIAPNLLGGCAIGSDLFVRVSRKLGLNTEMALGAFDTASHAWVVVRTRGGRDKLVVDVTATQFGRDFPAVYVEKVGRVYRYLEKYRGEEALKAALGWSRIGDPRRFQSPALHEYAMQAEMIRLFG